MFNFSLGLYSSSLFIYNVGLFSMFNFSLAIFFIYCLFLCNVGGQSMFNFSVAISFMYYQFLCNVSRSFMFNFSLGKYPSTTACFYTVWVCSLCLTSLWLYSSSIACQYGRKRKCRWISRPSSSFSHYGGNIEENRWNKLWHFQYVSPVHVLSFPPIHSHKAKCLLS